MTAKCTACSWGGSWPQRRWNKNGVCHWMEACQCRCPEGEECMVVMQESPYMGEVLNGVERGGDTDGDIWS